MRLLLILPFFFFSILFVATTTLIATAVKYTAINMHVKRGG